jgi:hypothetical protein
MHVLGSIKAESTLHEAGHQSWWNYPVDRFEQNTNG